MNWQSKNLLYFFKAKNQDKHPCILIKSTCVSTWAIHNGANWQDDGAKIKIRWGQEKSMNGAYLPVFLIEVTGAIFYLYF